MKEHPVTMYECEVCGNSSTDRAIIERCEARGVPALPAVGTVGYVKCAETEHLIGESFRRSWIVKVRTTAYTHQGHAIFCTVEVVPWPDADHDEWHQNVFSYDEEPGSMLFDDLILDAQEAEDNILS